MSAIPASSVKCSTLVDGTLRIVVEVEPNHALDAFTLFRSPGTPMALAALKINGGASEGTPEQQRSQPGGSHRPDGEGGLDSRSPPPLKEGPSRRMGPICEWLVYRCKEPEFREWVGRQSGSIVSDEGAADWCRRQCGVNSRKDIDGNADAEALFRRDIQQPWAEHQRKAGIAEHASR